MEDYRTGRIYKIVNIISDKIYIGSTVMKLCDRISCHRRDARNGRKSNLYEYMRNIGIYNFYIELIKEVSVLDQTLLSVLEQKEIDKYDSSLLLNQNRAIGVTENIEQYKNVLLRGRKLEKDSEERKLLKRERDRIRTANYRKREPEKVKTINKKYREQKKDIKTQIINELIDKVFEIKINSINDNQEN